METNVGGTVSTVEHFIPLLRESENPRVIFVSSGLGSATMVHDTLSNLELPAYSSSKAALQMIMLYYWRRFPRWKVNACNPGYRVSHSRCMRTIQEKLRTSQATKANKFGANVPKGAQPGPITEAAFNAVRLALLGTDGESGTHTMYDGRGGYRTVPW